MKTKLTPEQKEQRELIKKIESKKAQKEVKQIDISIEWKKSRMWGYNPHLTAKIRHFDGTYTYISSKCSGCGYDKESTVIADVFNATLSYELYKIETLEGAPYGIHNYRDNLRVYSGGIGVDCYYSIAEFINGKFERVASGKTFDAYKFTKNEVNQ